MITNIEPIDKPPDVFEFDLQPFGQQHGEENVKYFIKDSVEF